MRKTSWFILPLLAVLLLSIACPAWASEAVGIQGYSKSTGYQYVTFGTYPTDADGTVRPILWRVLRSADGEAYMMTEYILFASPVHEDYDHYPGWEGSDLFAYLNNEFKQDAFSPAEQQALLVRTEDGGLVTLATIDEMRDASLGFASNNDRLCESTEWAKEHRIKDTYKKSLYIYSKGHKYSPWWSRTRSQDYAHEQRRVMDEGKLGRVSSGNVDLGVRPVVTVNLSLLTIAGGSGAKDSPFQLQPTDAAAAAVPEELPADETLIVTEDIATNEPEAASTPVPVDAPAAEPTQAPEQPPVEPVVTEAPATEAPPAAAAGFTAAAKPEYINEKFPALDEKGFLPEGQPEFVLVDEENGQWLYASHTLRVEINRRTGTNSKKQPLRWYEAQIFTRDTSELFDLYPWDETKYTNINAQVLADEIAKKHHLVFAINSDYFIYRVERDREESYNYPLGIEIRNGEVLCAWPRNALSTVYPPLDVMAFYPDGSIQLFKNDQLYTDEFVDYLKRSGRDDYKALAESLKANGQTPEQLIAGGATDTLSFGPILVENGQVSPRSTEFGNTPNPRTAFGMVEPGYYICVMVESRIAESKGESCVWMGQKMAELGCWSAINLDGGATSTMIFMGKQVNKSGNYGDITNRKQNEVLGIGYSDAVQ